MKKTNKNTKNKIIVNSYTIINNKPKEKGKKFIYTITYFCKINSIEKSGGTVEVKLISPRKLRKKEIKNIASLNSLKINSLIVLQYKELKSKLSGYIKLFDTYNNKGFLGFGKPKINFNGKLLNKEEFLEKELRKLLILNDNVEGKLELIFKDKKKIKEKTDVKTIMKFKNFKLPSF